MHTSTRIFLLRHGETIWNTERRLQGHKDSKLTRKEREQACYIGLQLRDFISGAPRLISSPLGRCRETAALVAKNIEFDPSEIEYDDRVKELSFGRWKGQKISDIELNDAETFQMRRANRWDIPAPDGESYSLVAERLRTWLHEIEGQILMALQMSISR